MPPNLFCPITLALLLTACAPAQVATPAPTATLTPIPVPTATPTPTPIPTLPPGQVGGLEGVPDPRATNPELFDLRSPDAPIPQFVNAMKMGGITIIPEEILQKLEFLTDSATQRVFYITTIESDGVNYTMGFYYNPDEKQWRELTIKEAAHQKGIEIGAEGSGWALGNPDYLRLLSKEVDGVTFDYPTINWSLVQPSPDSFRESVILTSLNRWKSMGFKFLVPPNMLDSPPNWLKNGNYSKDQVEAYLIAYIKKLTKLYIHNDIREAWLVNEPYLYPYRQDDFLYKAFGNSYEYIEVAAKAAKEAVRELRDQGMNVDFELIVNDTDNHSPNGLTYNLTRKISTIPEIDIVGVEGHLGDWVRFYPPDQVKSALLSFNKPIYITEFDITQKGISGDDIQKNVIQSREAQKFLKAAIETGVVQRITFWGLTENTSWLEQALNQPDSNPTPYITSTTPKPLYYAILGSFLP